MANGYREIHALPSQLLDNLRPRVYPRSGCDTSRQQRKQPLSRNLCVMSALNVAEVADCCSQFRVSRPEIIADIRERCRPRLSSS